MTDDPISRLRELEQKANGEHDDQVNPGWIQFQLSEILFSVAPEIIELMESVKYQDRAYMSPRLDHAYDSLISKLADG